MKYFIRKFPFSLLGISAIGLWGNFYSGFFGLGFTIPVLIVIFFSISAFTDFYRRTKDRKNTPVSRQKGVSIWKYTDTAPFSLGMLAMLSFLGAMNFAGMKDHFDFWYALPAIADLILIILSFRKFYAASISEDPETPD